MYYKKMLGQKIGKWTVIGIGDNTQGKHTKLLCRCECGTERLVDAYSLYHRLTYSCGKCNTIVSEGNHLRCYMRDGDSFIFDCEDVEIAEKHTWSTARDGRARTLINGSSVYFHRLIMNAPDGMQIDHINMDKSDNRKSNLRIATHAENQRNRGLRSDNSTGYKGVCYDKRSGRYIAYINADYKRTYLGYYDDPIEAAMAYDLAAIKLHGEFARTNFGKEETYGITEILELEQGRGDRRASA